MVSKGLGHIPNPLRRHHGSSISAVARNAVMKLSSQTAVKVTDGNVEVVSEGGQYHHRRWRHR
jgi:hypothetical protein